VAITLGDGNYDSGIVTLAAVVEEMTRNVIRARNLLLCNLTLVTQYVTVTDRTGGYRLKDYPLQARMTQLVPLGGVTMDGVKWGATAPDAVTAQLVGEHAGR
jgi:hypothetical protein